METPPKTYFGTDESQEEIKPPCIGGKLTPKNQYCLRGVDEKYIQWNKILRDILNGKLQLIQNRTRKTESESKSEERNIEDRDDTSGNVRHFRKGWIKTDPKMG